VDDCHSGSLLSPARIPVTAATPERVAGLLAGHPLGLDCYFVKNQSSGLMLSVVLCGVTPWRLLATSVSW
jgi:hypothetical protein